MKNVLFVFLVMLFSVLSICVSSASKQTGFRFDYIPFNGSINKECIGFNPYLFNSEHEYKFGNCIRDSTDLIKMVNPEDNTFGVYLEIGGPSIYYSVGGWYRKRVGKKIFLTSRLGFSFLLNRFGLNKINSNPEMIDSLLINDTKQREIFAEGFGPGYLYSLNFAASFGKKQFNRYRFGISYYYDYLINSSDPGSEIILITEANRSFLKRKKSSFFVGLGFLLLPDIRAIFKLDNYSCSANYNGQCSKLPYFYLYGSLGYKYSFSSGIFTGFSFYVFSDFVNNYYPYGGVSIGKNLNYKK
ncbi:MAG TPA: hypothetical protein PK637_15330 [Flavobacteriales bacterium]|nr:hypothetical protein [Flavobacteriales bacterium]HRE98135.1 hypothetical protein [Flavobacteriales bacterium]